MLVVLLISALGSVALSYVYSRDARELRLLQSQAAMVNNNRNLITALAAESVEYGKRNPAINPILEAAGLKPGPGAPAPAKPAGK